MSFLIAFSDVCLAFGDQKILTNANLQIVDRERVCLIGRNGAGKSSTLKLVTGELEPDEGRIERPSHVRISKLHQGLDDGSDRLVRDVVGDGMAAQGERIARFEALSAQEKSNKLHLDELEALERSIEAGGGWSVDQQVDSIISQLDLPADARMDTLSGGWRRRVALAQALVSQPELLLLDEPTNHLDISTIEWLEREVQRYAGALLFVTHDREFVDRVATRIVEIDRGAMRSWPGGYRDFLRQKQKANQDEDRQNREFDKKLAEEEIWIRQGIKARESRNEGRVRALVALREERAQRIARPRAPKVHVNESEQLSGRKVIEVRNVSHKFGEQPLLDGFSLRVMRGERIGIIGNNGVGKTTLLRILLGELEPNAGSVKLGTNLEIGYFDQLRRELDTSRTVAEIVGEGREYINVNGSQKHVVGYLTDFLFSAKRAMTRVSALSGGERNRVILAKLFTLPSNLLVLDEPTNDLDVETLEALEARLIAYEGTLLVVSHDRHFLDRVVTSTLVFEGDGTVERYVGGYSDWARLQHTLATTDGPDKASRKSSKAAERADGAKPTSRKLSYKLQRELEALPDTIDALENEIAALEKAVNDPSFYERPREEISKRFAELDSLRTKLEAKVTRWEELESARPNASDAS
ncbi:MAG: ATP-binding cassette domain-containing protein [Gammaproteobacteria bacterium]|nr:ATP-binding cassette domain-containing protein [Gammaproteobacteria bacterium]MDH3508990.1 ATP-binding cassette domain-containing protein [Gammaproteobacteria bacterium]